MLFKIEHLAPIEQIARTPAFADAGWRGLQHPVDFGGQGLPKTMGAACIEMSNSANLSVALCPLLSDGAIEALPAAGSDVLSAKRSTRPRMTAPAASKS